MKNIRKLLEGYLLVGVVILLIQSVLFAVAPSCRHGGGEAQIWSKHSACSEIEYGMGLCTEAWDGTLRRRGLVRAATVVVAWLPDLAGVVGDPEMTLIDYFRGGYRCEG